MPLVTVYQNSALNVSLPINLASRTVFRFYSVDNNGNQVPLTGFTSANFVIYPTGQDAIDVPMQIQANGDVILLFNPYWWTFGNSINDCAIFLDNDYVPFVSGTVAFGIVIQPNQAYAIMNASRNAALINGTQYENPRYIDSSTAQFSVTVDSITGVATVTVNTKGGTWYTGIGAPSNALGANGDFYFDTNSYDLYGPKASGAWPTPPVSFITDQELIDALATKQDLNNNLTQISGTTFAEGDLIGKSGGVLTGVPETSLPLSTATINALDIKQDLSEKGQANGYTPLDSTSMVPTQYLPSFSFPVTSVFNRTGAVTAQSGDYTAADVGLGNVDNTSDINKPVSTAQAAADAAVLSTAESYTDSEIETEIIINSDSGTIGPINIGTKPQTFISMTGNAKTITGASIPTGNFHKIIIIQSFQLFDVVLVNAAAEDETAFTLTGVANLTLKVNDAAAFMFYPGQGWIQISLSQIPTNVATATALQTGRTISITGDLSYTSPTFDGTGNITGAGTLATVNSNVGTFGSATEVAQVTVNGKGLVTAVSNVTIGNAATATALQTGRTISATGDATGTSAAFDGTAASEIPLTLATVNSNVGSFGSATQVTALTVNAKGLVTAAASTSIQIAESQVTNLTTDLAAKNATINTAYLADSKTANTAGGTATSGSRATRALIEITDSGNIVSVSSNQFTLNAGTYHIRWRTPGFGCGAFQSWLRNVTDNSDTIIGSSAYSDNSTPTAVVDSTGGDTFTIVGSKTYQIEMQVNTTKATNGLGVAANLGSNEIYTQVWIIKYA